MVKYSEILLKSKMTRVILERMLERNIRHALSGYGFHLSRGGGIVLIDVDHEEECVEKLRRVFGVVYISICDVLPADMERIVEKCVEIGRKFKKGSSFAIRARRVGEHNFSSMQLCIEAGSRMLKELKHKRLKVDLEEPDEEVFVDVRWGEAFVSRKNIKAYGGMPVGSQGKAVAVITDRSSYLAAWMMMRRGCGLIAVCSKRGKKLAEGLRGWHSGSEMEVVNLSSKHPRVSKRELFREAGRVARARGAAGVVSGESLCRKQKLAEMREMDELAGVPVYRPLILLKGIDGVVID